MAATGRNRSIPDFTETGPRKSAPEADPAPLNRVPIRSGSRNEEGFYAAPVAGKILVTARGGGAFRHVALPDPRGRER